MEEILGRISDIMWGLPMIIVLIGTHLYLTFRTKFMQRHIFKGVRLSFKGSSSAGGDVSPFGSLTIALAATLGTGNIVGVATAVVIGGPGAVFWMWITGVLGLATKYSEGVLAVKYRVHNADGSYSGGPMYTLDRGLKVKWLAVLFAIFTVLASFGIGNTVQSNSIATLLSASYSLPTWVTGLILTFLTALVIIGGIRSIARVCVFFVPIFAGLYILGGLYILAVGYETLPHTISLIFSSAFTGHAAVGGFVGAALMQTMRIGIARGLFSNESGMGSAPIVAAVAKTPNPVQQGLVSASGTFWDTVVVCALTGLIVVNSGEWTSGYDGAVLTRVAFEQIPVIGPFIVEFGLLSFVFSTIIGWYCYGEKSISYLLGPKVVMAYKIVWVALVYVGATVSLKAVWSFADIANGLMVLPNVVALWGLTKIISKETDKYLGEKGNLNNIDEDIQ